ncbi:hypothetical protein MKW98_032651 [Papaver atlanticum]|uniref:Uncharacterized protein n=1 Tax=Papaver atlanticum TaxID=357466 RepID=A0AAD4SWH5_9MAGN|nr:hypothetical protein MKW98_032651 [Papaver atlanticum]
MLVITFAGSEKENKYNKVAAINNLRNAHPLFDKRHNSLQLLAMPTAVKVIRVFKHPENMVEKVSRPMNLIVHILFSDKEACLRKLYRLNLMK